MQNEQTISNDETQTSSSTSVGTPTIDEDASQSDKTATLEKREIVLVGGNPSDWTSDEIKSWLNWSTKEFSIEPSPDHSKFPDSGNELVKMTRADFWVCAGSKRGGNLLAKHMAYLLYRATGRSHSPLLSDEDPGKLITKILFLLLLSMTVGNCQNHDKQLQFPCWVFSQFRLFMRYLIIC